MSNLLLNELRVAEAYGWVWNVQIDYVYLIRYSMLHVNSSQENITCKYLRNLV